MRFEKEFAPYPDFIVYNFETTIAPLNKHPTDNLTYLSRDAAVSIALHDKLGEKPVYFVDENLEHLTESFMKILTKKQDVLNNTHIPLIFKYLQGM